MKKGVTSVALLAGVLTLAILGIAYALWSKNLRIDDVVETGIVNADFIDASTDDPPGTIDPGYDKNVAECMATVVDEETVHVVINRGYPSYTCTFETVIQNMGTLPERREALEFDVPPVLTITELIDLTGTILDPGEKDVERFKVHVE